ncbi:MAG: hypothetical protein RIM99_05465 [Cyclobacteriaceae bacterium]
MFRNLTLILIFLPGVLLAGGGWPKGKGTGYFKLTHWWLNSAKHYTTGGNQGPNAQTGIYTTSLYAEYGFTDRITGLLYFPFLNKTSNDANTDLSIPEGSISTIGDTDIGIKYGISNPGSQFAFAGTLILGLPLGDDDGGPAGILQTGDGEFNQMLQFDLSRSASIGIVSGYGSIYSAFNNRNNDFSDEIRFGGEVGISGFNNRAWLIIRVNIVNSLNNGVTTNDPFQGATIFANNTEFSSYGYQGAVYLTEKLGVSAAYTTAFGGENIFASPSYSVGVFFDMK